MRFKQLEGLLNEVTQVNLLSLGVVDPVSDVSVAVFEEVEHGQDLAVVGHKGFANSVRAGNESLQDLEGDGNDFMVAGVKGG